MKNINKILFTGFFLTVLFSCLNFTVQSENLSQKLIRMHVLANSDSDYDQAIKLEVKDEVASFTNTLAHSAQSIIDAEKIFGENIGEIEKIANQKLEQLNVNYTASVSLTDEDFPTREYDTFTLPAGEYKSLKINLGTAQGHNWWCVVYPSLCASTAFNFEEEENALSDEEVQIITETPQISFKIYEWYIAVVDFLNF